MDLQFVDVNKQNGPLMVFKVSGTANLLMKMSASLISS